MHIKCKNCGHTEEVTKHLFVKILGGAVAGFGFWAWVSFLFAGTGFAMAICVAIVMGGVAMAAFSDEITQWLSDRFECPTCKRKAGWEAYHK